MKTLPKFLRPTLLLASAFFVLVALGGMPQTAEAGISGCRGDPIIYLSDGTSITVTVDIMTDVSNVKTIGYAIHTPHGVKLVRVVYTPMPGFAGKEQFAFNDDNQPNTFSTDTVVQTSINNISIVATTYLDNQSVAVSGVNAQHLKATLIR